MAYRLRLPDSDHRGSGSIAAFNGHPIHPLLVPVVIGMYVAAVFADVAFAKSDDPFWARN